LRAFAIGIETQFYFSIFSLELCFKFDNGAQFIN